MTFVWHHLRCHAGHRPRHVLGPRRHGPESQDKDQLTRPAEDLQGQDDEHHDRQRDRHVRVRFRFSRPLLQRQRSLIAPARTAARRVRTQADPAQVLLLLTLGGIVAGAAIGWWISRLLVGVILLSVILAVRSAVLRATACAPSACRRSRSSFRRRSSSSRVRCEPATRSRPGWAWSADEVPKPAGPEFRRVYDEQNFGMSLPEALRAMAKRVPVLDARFFVTAVLTQRESGGNLSEVLDNLASVMRERFKVKRQIRVISAHGRLSAWILSCLAPALAGVAVPDVAGLHAHPVGGPARRPVGDRGRRSRS